MDKVIKSYFTERDLVDILVTTRGVAYQKDMSKIIRYNGEYFNKLDGYRGQEIAVKINKARKDMVDKYAKDEKCLDIGCGAGEFIQHRPLTWGYDINEKSIDWLKGQDRYSDNFEKFKAFAFWDVIEHVPEPETYFDRIQDDSHVFVSIPIFKDIYHLKRSRHYRPNEHLYYFTKEGFINWMRHYGFRKIEENDQETLAGRDSIYSFAFKKDIPSYKENTFLRAWMK